MRSKSDLPMEEVSTPAPAGIAEANPTAAAEVSAPLVVPNPASTHVLAEEIETISERLGEGALKSGFGFAFFSDNRQNCWL